MTIVGHRQRTGNPTMRIDETATKHAKITKRRECQNHPQTKSCFQVGKQEGVSRFDWTDFCELWILRTISKLFREFDNCIGIRINDQVAVCKFDNAITSDGWIERLLWWTSRGSVECSMYSIIHSHAFTLIWLLLVAVGIRQKSGWMKCISVYPFICSCGTV